LYSPRIPLRLWLVSGLIFSLLQIPWVIDDVWRGVPGPMSILRGDLFTFPFQDAQDIEYARAGALGYIGSITETILFDDRKMLYVGVGALAVMVASAGWTIVRRKSLQTNADLFFLLWSAMFLVLPAYLGAGGRVYLAQFLGPVSMARGLTLPLGWLAVRPWRSARRTVQVVYLAGAIIAIWLAGNHLAGPRPTSVLSDPALPQSLEEIRSVVRHVHERGLGRIGFNQRVHGAVLQSDLFADSYLFWTVCQGDANVPCSAGAEALSPQTHFVVLEPEFPFRPAEGMLTQYGTLRLVEYESRLRLPFEAIAFPAVPPSAARTNGQRERVAGPPRALRTPAPGVSASREADRFSSSAQWPADRPGAAVFPIRRASQVAALINESGLDGSFAGEARYPGPDGSPLEVVLRGTLEIDRLPDPGKELHLFLTASPDGGRCQASLLLDGLRLPQSRFDKPGADSGHPLLTVQADTTGVLRPGRHSVVVRLHDCSAERYDFYDLVVWGAP
jgi:hypothetical protein